MFLNKIDQRMKTMGFSKHIITKQDCVNFLIQPYDTLCLIIRNIMAIYDIYATAIFSKSILYNSLILKTI